MLACARGTATAYERVPALRGGSVMGGSVSSRGVNKDAGADMLGCIARTLRMLPRLESLHGVAAAELWAAALNWHW